MEKDENAAEASNAECVIRVALVAAVRGCVTRHPEGEPEQH